MTDPLKDLQILIDKYIKIAVIAQTVSDEYEISYLLHDHENIKRLREALEELKDETRHS